MRSVLLVEPHADTRELYAGYLRSKGYSVLVAPTTDAALPLATEVMTIITEVRVPGTHDGLGFIRELRSAPGTKSTPVIVLSAGAFPANIVAAMQAGCDLFLAKPCLPQDLWAALRRVVRTSRTGRVIKAPHRGRTQIRRRGA
jgi:two-component system, cell cycle response regulator DivK